MQLDQSTLDELGLIAMACGGVVTDNAQLRTVLEAYVREKTYGQMARSRQPYNPSLVYGVVGRYLDTFQQLANRTIPR